MERTGEVTLRVYNKTVISEFTTIQLYPSLQQNSHITVYSNTAISELTEIVISEFTRQSYPSFQQDSYIRVYKTVIKLQLPSKTDNCECLTGGNEKKNK